MADKLVEQGMSADIAQSTANAITSVALVRTGTAAGLDISSAGMAANVDANNRQLHPQEKVLADILFRKAKKEGWKRADGKPYTLQEIEDALRWANSTKYGEQWTSKRTVKIHKNASKDGINKAMYDHGIASDFDSRLWKTTSTGEYTTITQNFNNIEKPDTNLVNFIKGETKSYGYSWTSGVPQPYNAKTAGPTPKPKPTTTAQIIPQRSLDNRNQAIINNNGSIDSGSLPAAQQQANQKTFDAAVMVVDAVGLATGAGEVVIAVKWAGKKTIQYVVKKSALDAAKQGTTSVDDLIKVSKPYTGSISNSQRGSTGIAKPDKIDNVISENRSYQGIYDPKEVRTDLEAVYGQNSVTSTTIPKKPHQASATRDDVIVDANGNRAVQVTMDDGSIKNIPYDNRGLPIFDDVSVFTAKIDHSKSYTGQMKQASKDMWESIKDDPVAKSKFTERQLSQLEAGSHKIKGFTWHHNAQSSPNTMQLVPEKFHDRKAVPHSGQNSLKQGK
jgi:filamentous hemagglutinin